jgi:hypothetical protein
MQNELTNTVQQKFLNNRHLAFTLRTKLRQRLTGSDTALAILSELTDEQLVTKYLTHIQISKIPADQLPPLG